MRSLAMTGILMAAFQQPICCQAVTRSDSLRIIAQLKADSQRNFSGWRSLLVYCEAPDSQSEALCDSAITQVKYLAAISGVGVETRSSVGEFSYSMWSEREYLPLELVIVGTKGDGPSALSARLRAFAPFDHAVEKDKATSTARAGKLILWENYAIGASSTGPEQLFTKMTTAIETLLKQFFADYVGVRRSTPRK